MKIVNLIFFILLFTLVRSQAPDPGLLVNIHSATATDLPGLLAGSAIGSLIYNETDNIIEVRTAAGWKSLETLTTFVDNGDGTYTFTNELGQPQVITIEAQPQTLEVTKETLGYNFAAGHSAANGNILYAVNSEFERIAAGFYEVTFESAHPNGANYPITLGVQEDATNRDGRIIQIITGSQTNTGFQVQIMTGDNGGSPDVRVDEIWYYNVVAEIDIVTDIATTSTGTDAGNGIPTGTQTNTINLNNFGDAGMFQLSANTGNNGGATWEILISNRPYNSLPPDTTASVNGNTVPTTISSKDNGDGTYDILIASNIPLPNFNPSLIISSSSTTTPPGTQFNGQCTCVTFYIN